MKFQFSNLKLRNNDSEIIPKNEDLFNGFEEDVIQNKQPGYFTRIVYLKIRTQKVL